MSRRATEDDALSLAGLARRAGAVVLGTEATRRAVRSGEALCVLTARDASPTQSKKVTGLARERRVPHRVVADRRALGAALGSASLSAVAVTDPSFAQQILERLDSRQERAESEPDRDTGGS